MTKIKAALLIFILLVPGLKLFSLGSGETREAEHIRISFWHSSADAAGLAFDDFVREFNAGPGAEKNISVEAIFQGQYSEASTKLRPLLQSRQAAQLPDVMEVDATGVVDFLNTEYAYTVDDALLRDSTFDLGQIMESPLRAWNYGGRQLGLPLSASTNIMYYNKSILDAAGVNRAPKTFDEIIEISRRLPPVNENNQRLTAYANQPNTPLLANWIGQIPGRDGVNSSYLVNNRNGRDGNATVLTADTEGTLLMFLRAWKSMFDAGALLNVSSGLSNLFVTQQIVFYTASTSQLTGLLNQIDNRFELGTANFPKINSSSNFGAAVSGSAVFMFNKDRQGSSSRTDAAWEFVKFITSAEIQARFAAATGYMPVNMASEQERVYLEHISSIHQARTGVRQLSITSPDMMGVIVGPSRNFYFEIENQVSAMLTNQRSPEETLASMSQALNLLLDDFSAANQ